MGERGGSSMESRVGARGEQKRRWDRENLLTCACGRSMTRQAQRCTACDRAAKAASRDERCRRIEAWWAEGVSMLAISARLGWAKNTLAGEMDWMRHHGYSLPHRYRSYGSKRPAIEEHTPGPTPPAPAPSERSSP